ncbi:amp dependent CoA ligase [Dissoconium aciculare CBS 342.82]|uniref:Amp dependent CoA ligase n=1 Tax=Dissoconium aciculare CBS 342.82 TaxID=1314786 RepID=A0A6J3M455_9PEZI|nr:amp dependent CoA ligase [Dissoconium aciculare CBS 342.82]KAF1822264.1 amp dependent CoA ligase [Dissoconium aciculare CBS 342.82]
MPFTSPEWVPTVQDADIPSSISLDRFMLSEQHGRHPLGLSRPPFTCALSGKSYSATQLAERVDHLARALCDELGFDPHKGSEWEKVVAIYSLNTIDYTTVAWAVHRIGGILTCVSAAYNSDEVAFQLRDSGAKAVFTCAPLLETCKKGIAASSSPGSKVFILPLPEEVTPPSVKTDGLKTIENLIQHGSTLPPIRPSDESWKAGEGAEKIAFLCYSSGTSGLPKGVKISHKNCISNILQMTAYESLDRNKQIQATGDKNYTESCLGLLPFSHIYGLIVLIHVGPYRGDGVIVMPKYDFTGMLQAIERYKINILYLVPPMIIHMTNQKAASKKFDLSSVRAAFSGAAPLGSSTAAELKEMFPDWALRQGYGSTESCTVVTSTATHDIWLGSVGSILPGMTVRLMDADGQEVTGYDQPGELWVKSPSVVPGYHLREGADKETFVDGPDGRYLRTGDEAVVRRSPLGHEHVFITDRIKELIKVKGYQVAPAELEAILLTHEAVSDCVVIGVYSEREGEVPKAFVVRAPGSIEESDVVVKRSIMRHVQKQVSRYKWLAGGIEFIDAVPKSPSGKILRRLIRDQEKAKARERGAKL